MLIFRNLKQLIFSGKSEPIVLVLGHDSSGKTTLLYKLKLDEVVQTIPSIGINVETVTINTHPVRGFKSPSKPSQVRARPLTMTLWDVGGGCGGLSYHFHILRTFAESGNLSGVIWAVNGADTQERLKESMEGLKVMLGVLDGSSAGGPNEKSEVPLLM